MAVTHEGAAQGSAAHFRPEVMPTPTGARTQVSSQHTNTNTCSLCRHQRMASPSPTQKAAAYQRRSNVLLTAVSGACVCVLVVALACDPDAHFHTHLAVAFAISTTLFAPIDRAQVQLQV